jgi:uncharacterized low-complexity protein
MADLYIIKSLFLSKFRPSHLLFTTLNHRLDMKRILASVAAVAAITGFAATANAQAQSSDVTVTQTGIVSGTCTIKKTADGSLPSAGLVNSISSSTPGKIETVCNTMISKLTVALDPSTPASVILEAGRGEAPMTITRKFNLTNGTQAYAATGSAGFTEPGFGNTSKTYTNLSNNYVATPSSLDVLARVEVSTGKILPAGGYPVKVVFTVTP